MYLSVGCVCACARVRLCVTHHGDVCVSMCVVSICPSHHKISSVVDSKVAVNRCHCYHGKAKKASLEKGRAVEQASQGFWWQSTGVEGVKREKKKKLRRQ